MEYDQIKELIKTQSNSRSLNLTGLVRTISKRKIFIIFEILFIISLLIIGTKNFIMKDF